MCLSWWYNDISSINSASLSCVFSLERLRWDEISIYVCRSIMLSQGSDCDDALYWILTVRYDIYLSLFSLLVQEAGDVYENNSPKHYQYHTNISLALISQYLIWAGRKKFWSTKDKYSKAYSFTVGVGKVIKGWDEGTHTFQHLQHIRIAQLHPINIILISMWSI